MTTLAEVLTEHQWTPDLNGCTCDDGYRRIGNDAAMAQHQTEAVAAAGLAVVELPEPGEAANDLMAHYDLSLVENPDGQPPIKEAGGGWSTRWFSANGARTRAAALLAAANAAEAVSA